MASFFQWLFQGLFPPQCIISGEPGSFLAKKHRKFPKPPLNKAKFKHVDKIIAVTAYDDPVIKKIIHDFKFQGLKDLAPIMAQAMIKKLATSNQQLVTIPLHWTRKIWRGFNQAEILAQEMQKINKNLVIDTGLKRIKKTSQQARLDKNAREKNLKNAFVWRGKKEIPEKIILIDDVVATGSTLDEAAGVLKKAGCKEIWALVFARGGK